MPEPAVQEPTDAIVRLTASAICGSDLHVVRGTMPGTKEGRTLGHEGVGVVEEVGAYVRNLMPGDRVVIPSTIACGTCSYCRAGYYSQCDHANPNGDTAAFFGGPEEAGGFDGLQAELARIPYANVGLVKLPEEVTDDQAILLSDIFPTGYQAAHMAGIRQGDVVCVFGCGPVGQFAIWNAKHLGAGRVLAVDAVPDRLELARAQGAEVVNFEEENTVDLIAEVTRGVGPGPRHRRGRHRREPTARGRRPGVRGGDRGARARARARRAAPAAGLRAVLRARVGGRGGGEGGDDLPSGSTRRPRRASRSATRS